ncbi:MAG: transposase family protein [Cyanobacteria bacterium P01_H01_bin.15]
MEYRREYRTYFHIAQNWQCSEATICRSVQRVKKILSESQKFHLPGKTVEAGVSVNRGGCYGDSH